MFQAAGMEYTITQTQEKYVSEELKEQFWLRQRGQDGVAMTAKAKAKSGKAL